MSTEIEQLKAENAKLHESLKKAKETYKSQKSSIATLKTEISDYSGSPEIAQNIAQMKYELSVARQFSASGAFPDLNPEKIYVLMKAGGEMGLTPLESLNALYIVKGAVRFHSKALIAQFTKHGYAMLFEESFSANPSIPESCTLTVTKGDEKYVETVYASDPALANSKAMKGAPRNKLRYHAARFVGSFHLAHLFGSVSMWTEDNEESTEIAAMGRQLEEETAALETMDATEFKAYLKKSQEYIRKHINNYNWTKEQQTAIRLLLNPAPESEIEEATVIEENNGE